MSITGHNFRKNYLILRPEFPEFTDGKILATTILPRNAIGILNRRPLPEMLLPLLSMYLDRSPANGKAIG